MIMPKKHISLSESYIGFGAIILEILSSPMTIDECWEIIQKKFIQKDLISKKHSFDSYILTLDLLYILDTININDMGEIYNVHKET